MSATETAVLGPYTGWATVVDEGGQLLLYLGFAMDARTQPLFARDITADARSADGSTITLTPEFPPRGVLRETSSGGQRTALACYRVQGARPATVKVRCVKWRGELLVRG